MLGSLRNGRRVPSTPRVLGVASAALLFAVAACDSPLDPELALVLSQQSLEFRAVRGSTTPVTRTIEVSNAGGGRLGPVTCPAAPAPWLSCAVTSGNVITLTANPSGLVASPPQATVPFSAPGATGASTLLVDLRIDQPVLTLSTGTLAFAATEGGNATNPAQGIVVVTNTGTGALADLGPLSCVPTPANARVTCSVNPNTGGLTVAVDPAGLTPGTYVFPVTVSAVNAAASSTFTATLSVGALPRIALSQRSLHFQAIRGATQTQSQTVQVSNSGGGSLGALTCSAPPSWLTCSVSGSNVTVTANPAGLSTAPAPATVSVSAVGATNSPQTVSVTLQLDQPVVAVSPTNVSFATAQGTGVSTPTSVTVAVANAGAGTLANLGTVTCTPPAQSPVNCAVSAGQLTFTLGTTNLVPGVTHYPVVVAAQHSAVNASVTVTVNVTPAPRIGLEASILHFTAIRGSSQVLTQSVDALNLGGGELGTVTCPENPAAWVSCTVQNDTIVVVSVTAAGLTESPNQVTFQVSAAAEGGVSHGSASLTVRLTVEQPVLAVSPNFLELTGTASATVQASNIGAGNLQNLGAIGCSAQSATTCSVNQNTGVITINTAPGQLAPGTYVRVVTVVAANADNSESVVVVLTVPAS